MLILATLGAACSEKVAAPPADSGIEGIVTIGPTCPVVSQDMPCPDRPFAADLLIVERGSRKVVARARSGADGRFRVALAPGDYIVQPLTEGSGPSVGAPVDVTVKEHAFTMMTVTFDSGIR